MQILIILAAPLFPFLAALLFPFPAAPPFPCLAAPPQGYPSRLFLCFSLHFFVFLEKYLRFSLLFRKKVVPLHSLSEMKAL